ncbi:O-antigen ligase family protein [Bordetella hinzii]|uniref:O-antigen ligase family protein n=1 Tax=Bordetella hinzii TaxID=103855 RepID=UPI0039FCF797|nr:O-antigen ligase family protein [Bordetella hinzii]
MGAQTVLPDAGGQSRGSRWAVWLLVGLSLLFAIVPDTLSVGELGPQATHTVMQGSMLRQVQYASLFLGAAIVAWRHLPVMLTNLRASNLFLLLLVVYCLASTAWSPYPDITLKRTVIFAGLVLIGLAVAPPLSGPRQFLRVVLGTYSLVLVLSFFVALLVPSVGVDALLGNAWRGITWQKNMLGSIAGFAVLLWLREWVMTPRIRRLAIAGFLFSAFMLVMTKSATAILVTALGAGVYLISRKRFLGGQHTGQILLLGGLLFLLYFLLVFFVAVGRMPQVDDVVQVVTSLFNKSSDLTGRGEIWALVDIAIERHKLLGIGYSAFWVGEGGPAQFIGDKLGWLPGQAHNGYLDILLDLGQVGMGLFLACLFWHVVSILRLYRIDREDAAMHLGICVTIMVSNFSESQILRDTNFQNIMFIYSSLAISGRLAMDGARRRAERRAAAPRPGYAPRRERGA